MIKHIVLIKFKKHSKEQKILKTKELLELLVNKIDCLLDMEVGINFDETQRAMDLSLYATFNTKDDLGTYSSHKDHLEVIKFIQDDLEYTKVVDYII